MTPSPLAAWVRTGVLGLPLSGLVATVAAVTVAPDPSPDPARWAEIVLGRSYLLGRLADSVLVPVLVVLGLFALLGVLAGGRGARLGALGVVLSVGSVFAGSVAGTLYAFGSVQAAASYADGTWTRSRWT